MHEDLYRMKKELTLMLREDGLLKSAVREVNKVDLIKGSLIVRNAAHDRIAVGDILKGDLQRDVPVKDYLFIENFCKLIRVAYNCLEMGNYLDKYLLISAYRILAEDEKGTFRKSNPVVYAFNHVPTYSLDIEDKLDDALRRVYNPASGNNVILKAMYIHNKLIEIYPFSEFSGELAVFAMNYYLMENGLMPVNMPISRENYLSIVGSCLKGQRQEEFYDFLCRAVYDKMQGTIDACREYKENRQ